MRNHPIFNSTDSSTGTPPPCNQSTSSTTKQFMFSPRKIANFFTRNVNMEQLGSPRMFIESLGYGSSQPNKAVSMFKKEDIQKQFDGYLTSINHHMQKCKANLARRAKEAAVEVQKQDLENMVRISKIPQEYLEEWDQENSRNTQEREEGSSHSQSQSKQDENHCKSSKLSLLMVPTAGMKSSRPNRINLKSQQQQLTEYLDQVQLIIFSRSHKHQNKYLLYLNNLNFADKDIETALQKIHKLRSLIQHKIMLIPAKSLKISQLTHKNKNIQEVKNLLENIKVVRNLKKLSGISDHSATTINPHLLQCSHPIYQVGSISGILLGLQETQQQIKRKSLAMIIKQLESVCKGLLHTYDREEWLRNEIPKNVIKQAFESKVGLVEEAVNNSYLNVSVLDQSYCMGAIKNQKEGGREGAREGITNPISVINKAQATEVGQLWSNYLAEYYPNRDFNTPQLLQEEQQQLGELLLKLLIRHNSQFSRDFEDYLTFIYAQKGVITFAQTHEQRVLNLDPKFYNKVITLYYLAVKNLINFLTLNFSQLKITHQKLIAFLKQRIQSNLKAKKIDAEMQLGEVVTLLSIMDFWITNSASLIDLPAIADQQSTLTSEQWELFIIDKKLKLVQEYINSFHEKALVCKLKEMINDESFQVISIPTFCFTTFDFILNWNQQGEALEDKLEVSVSFLGDLQKQDDYGRNTKFSIFKIIDKQIIIEGTKYKICGSVLLLLQQIEVYLKTKIYYPQLEKKADEKICQVIGFYSWYSKKVIIGTGSNNSKRVVRKLCLYRSVVLFVKKIMQILGLDTVPKKLSKLQADIDTIIRDVDKQLGIVPYTAVEAQVGKLYESELKARKECPTIQSMKIISIIEKTKQEAEQLWVNQKICLNAVIKVITKNYFGFLMNSQSRGKIQLKWFIPKLRECVGELYPEQISSMEKKLASLHSS